MSEETDPQLFPILRGVSVGETGQSVGKVVIICTPEELQREWDKDDIAVLNDDMEQHFKENPGDWDMLFDSIMVVIAEFGEVISEFAGVAYSAGAIALVKVDDATHVLENGMLIRVAALENVGDVFFIE